MSLHNDLQASEQLADRLDALLPQTQCTQCGFEGCRPYADAIANGEANINRCPPGGAEGIRQLAQLLGVAEIPLDTTCGQHGPLEVAVIDEAHCIGCTLCIQACPVDAIVGANLRMHTVLAADCTGCKLCIAPCPVDCITMQPVVPTTWWSREDANRARARFNKRNERLIWLQEVAHSKQPGAEIITSEAPTPLAIPAEPQASASQDQDAKKAAIAAALAKARERRQHGNR